MFKFVFGNTPQKLRDKVNELGVGSKIINVIYSDSGYFAFYYSD